MKGQADTYSEVKVFEYPDMTITVHFPDLTDEENERRMKYVEQAAIALVLSERQRKAKGARA